MNYTIRYSVEVVINRKRDGVYFRIVNTGIGWVLVSHHNNLQEALSIAKAERPLATFVLDKDIVNVHNSNGGSYTNGIARTDADNRERIYRDAIRYVKGIYPDNPDLLTLVDSAIREAFPVR